MFASLSNSLPRFSASVRSFSASAVGPSKVTFNAEAKYSSQELMKMESDFCAHNYSPMPIVFEKAKGIEVWDPEGKKYFDFLAAYSAVNQGHGHPRILETMHKQLDKAALSSRAFYNSELPKMAKFVTEFFEFDSVLPMNTGAEAVESALKLARKWGYEKKGIPENQAIILTASSNFHGRTISIVSFSDDEGASKGFGPHTPGFIEVEYNNIESLKAALEKDGKHIAAYLFEPIQGEAGVVVPDHGYLKAVHDLCKQHNVLVIHDEIQSGLGRTGRMLAGDWEFVRPSMITLGKALSGGVYPVSAVLADNDVMDVLTPGTHGSTYGGNPLAAAVTVSALQVLEEENLCENSEKLGELFRKNLQGIQHKFPFVELIRGKGLMNAMVISKDFHKSAYALCLIMAENGLLAKPTHDHIIRFSPPLVITEEQVNTACGIIEKSLTQFAEE
eukprot:TRINITY_DN1817_c0_g2_i1.p1 TRINITY_DN1817_c0_g2~~TRINITY_DN1817_c0_g2_i1.p1  ORF type:complete len:446 (+),score=120.96 TRINITY_DN1817_c0_g2_i1:112-1449(+)